MFGKIQEVFTQCTHFIGAVVTGGRGAPGRDTGRLRLGKARSSFVLRVCEGLLVSFPSKEDESFLTCVFKTHFSNQNYCVYHHDLGLIAYICCLFS